MTTTSKNYGSDKQSDSSYLNYISLVHWQKHQEQPFLSLGLQFIQTLYITMTLTTNMNTGFHTDYGSPGIPP